LKSPTFFIKKIFKNLMLKYSDTFFRDTEMFHLTFSDTFALDRFFKENN